MQLQDSIVLKEMLIAKVEPDLEEKDFYTRDYRVCPNCLTVWDSIYEMLTCPCEEIFFS